MSLPKKGKKTPINDVFLEQTTHRNRPSSHFHAFWGGILVLFDPTAPGLIRAPPGTCLVGPLRTSGQCLDTTVPLSEHLQSFYWFQPHGVAVVPFNAYLGLGGGG